MHTHALTSTEALGEPWPRAITANNLGVALIDRGDLDAAAVQYQAALTLFREIGDSHGSSTALANRAWVSHYRGEHAKALQDMLVAWDFYRSSAAARNAAITLRGIALVETALAKFDDAAEHAQQALRSFEELDLDLDAAMALNCLGWARFRSGDHELANVAYLDAAARSESCGSGYESARAETGLGNIAAAAGHLALAREHWDRADDTHFGLDETMVGEAQARRTAQLG
jgi:tetratricopeptide (TPR) repeat protein